MCVYGMLVADYIESDTGHVRVMPVCHQQGVSTWQYIRYCVPFEQIEIFIKISFVAKK